MASRTTAATPAAPLTTVSAESLAVVRATAPLVAENLDRIVADFYPRMLSTHPELYAFFNRTNQRTGRQGAALIESILAYATFLMQVHDYQQQQAQEQSGESAATTPQLDQTLVDRIAHKHCALNVLPEHYQVVHDMLLASVAAVLGTEVVSGAVAAAWSEAVMALAAVLIGREKQLYDEAAAGEGGWRGARLFEVVRRQQETADSVSLWLRPTDGGVVRRPQPGQHVSVVVVHSSSSSASAASAASSVVADDAKEQSKSSGPPSGALGRCPFSSGAITTASAAVGRCPFSSGATTECTTTTTTTTTTTEKDCSLADQEGLLAPRHYTVTAFDEHHYRITPKRLQAADGQHEHRGLFSNHLNQLKAGDRVHLLPPFGHISFPPPNTTVTTPSSSPTTTSTTTTSTTTPAAANCSLVVFVSSGIGITPVRALLPEALDAGAQVAIFHADHSANTHCFRNELAQLLAEDAARKQKQQQHSPTEAPLQRHYYSGDRDHDGGQDPCLAAGRLSGAALLAELKQRPHLEQQLDQQTAHFYVCCNPTLTAQVVKDLVAGGVPRTNVHPFVFGPHLQL